MGRGRLEAFSDGVIAILITIMVLELKVPSGTALADLRPLIPVFLSYTLSFVFIGIYWNNHHHMLHAVRTINGRILLANLHFLFWLSLIPFVTGWLGENPSAAIPVAIYGLVMVMTACAYLILARELVAHEGLDSPLAKALGSDFKGKVSLALYILAVVLSFVNSWIAIGLYVFVALLWFIPDRRIENMVAD